MAEVHPVIKLFNSAKDRLTEYLSYTERVLSNTTPKYEDSIIIFPVDQRDSLPFKIMFKKLRECHNVTAPLLESIKTFVSNGNTTESFTGFFSDYRNYFKVYFKYIKKFNNLNDKFFEERRNCKAVNDLFLKFEKEVDHRIESILYIPVQHICLYATLLDSLANKVDDSNKLKDAAHYAKQEIARMSILFKEVAEHEELANRGSVEGFELVKLGRRLLFRGEVTKYSRKTKDDRLLYLFSDGLLIVNPGKNHKFIKATEYDVENVPDVETYADLEELSPFINAINILTKSKSFCASFTSAKIKSRIINAINAAKKLTILNWPDPSEGNYAPVWIPDELVPKCMICEAKFTVINRRHHCRKCGKCICSKCCKKNPIPNSNKSQLVCTNCMRE